jgi:hypothetical protein
MALTEEQIDEIRKETEHRCDVYTDGDWFTEKVEAVVNGHLTEYLTKVVVALLSVVDLDEQAQETVGYFRAED